MQGYLWCSPTVKSDFNIKFLKSAKILFYISVESQFLEALNFSQTLFITQA